MLGDLISEAEVAAVFTRQCAEGKVTEGSRFDLTTLSTMARVNARLSAFKIATDGMKLILGVGAASAQDLAASVNLIGIEEKMTGLITDEDAVSAKLRDTSKHKEQPDEHYCLY